MTTIIVPTIINVPETAEHMGTTATIYGEWEYVRATVNKSGKREYARKSVISGDVQIIGTISALKTLWYREFYPEARANSAPGRYTDIAYWRPWMKLIDIWCRRVQWLPEHTKAPYLMTRPD